MKIFIEKENGEFRTVNGYTAWRGFLERGCEIEFFRADDVEALSLDASSPVIAGIPIVHRALRALGCTVPFLEPIPDELRHYGGRDTGHRPLGEVRRMVLEERGPLFIKPTAQRSKQFNGHVVSAFRDLIETSHLPDDETVWWSEAVPIRAEYRGFVHAGQLVGFRHYFGDFRAPVDFAPVENALRDWENRPAGCSMDWAVTVDGRTLLIEVNDGYALGTYGLAPHLYAPLLADRWLEMTRTNGTSPGR